MTAFSFEQLWETALELVEQEWPALETRSRRRPALSEEEEALGRCWQALSSRTGDPGLVAALEAVLRKQPRTAVLHNALGLATSLRTPARQPADFGRAAEHFGRAVALHPGYVLGRLNLAEALARAGREDEAMNQARQSLRSLEQQPEQGPLLLDGGHFPPAFDFFRVEWEQAARTNAGRPTQEAEAKRNLLRLAPARPARPRHRPARPLLRGRSGAARPVAVAVGAGPGPRPRRPAR